MPRFSRVFSSSIGKKLLIGLTGLALFAYLVLHLAGNALVFVGPDTFNHYAHQLVSNPLIVPIEIGLAAIFAMHAYTAVANFIGNRAARPVAYARKTTAGHTSRKTLSSSTMIASGLVVLLFVVIHVKQFKFGAWYDTAGDHPIRDLYRTEAEVFSRPAWVGFYALATLIVGLHLRHGIASGFQSLGLDHPVYTRRLTAISLICALVIGLGLAFIPIWVYLTT